MSPGTFALAGFAAIAATVFVACAPPGPAVAPQYEHVASVHRSRCGSCHTRVEPGARTRDQLEVALARHRTRVHLSEDDWNLMVDYLADKPAARAN